jgi:hypothetical protein
MSTSGGNFFINQSNDDAQASLTILCASSPRDCQVEDDPLKDDPQVMTISFASFPWDCKAELTTILVRTALSAMMKKLATLRNIRLPMDGRSAAGNGARAIPILFLNGLRPPSGLPAGSRGRTWSDLNDSFERGNGCTGGNPDLSRAIPTV